MRPRLLDLFCGAGGAAMGYSRAGFEVVGVDIKPQPNYPFEFIQAEALEAVECLLERGLNAPSGFEGFGYWLLGDFDAIHASPPCQAYSVATKRNGTQYKHPDLIGRTRDLLKTTGLPYIIENVVGAPLIDPVLICGTERGLAVDGYRLQRHRMFEANWPLGEAWPACGCPLDSRPVMDVSGGGPTHAPRLDGRGGRPFKGTADQVRRIMGMPWATKSQCNEAIPPAYTELIGAQLLAHIEQQVHPTAAPAAERRRSR